jgi:hypothetical protein
MTRLSAAAFVLLTSTSAFAQGTLTFEIDGQRVRIEAPRNCSSLDCLSISIPGVFETRPSGRRVAGLREAEPAPRRTVEPSPAPKVEPRVEAPVAVPEVPAPSPEGGQAVVEQPAPAPQPPAPPVASQVPPARAEASPIGVWATEGGKEFVRIEACGQNLCGYALKSEVAANGTRVLIDMKPAKGAWGGRIHDPNSGRTYDSTIALQGGGTLRVQGCAFGGLFCGGQTWTRVG